MAPKQKASDAGGSSGVKSSAAHNNSNSDRQSANSERGYGNSHNNVNATSERGGGSGAGNDRSGSGTGGGGGTNAGHGSNEKGSSLTATGSGTGAKRKADSQVVTVDFADMDITALRRYCRVNKLQPKDKSREELVAVANQHWQGITAKEVDSVAYFLFAVKHRHNVLKLTMPLP